MKTQCPECKKVFHLPAVYLDKQIKCPRCKTEFPARKFKKPPIVIPDQLPLKTDSWPTAAKKTAYAGYTLQVFGILVALCNIFNLTLAARWEKQNFLQEKLYHDSLGLPTVPLPEYAAAFTWLFVFLGLLLFAIGNLICWLGRIYLILNDKQK